MSLERKVGQMMMVGLSGTTLTSREIEHLEAGNAGFVSLFLRNFSSIEGVTALTNAIHDCGYPSPMIWTDQEGGNVVQFGESVATAISAMGLAATGRASYSRRAGGIIGVEVRALGVDGVFAPVLDVNTNPDNPIIGFRSFSDNPKSVARFAAAFARGLHKGGVANCGKHYPGHGEVVRDSHREIPRCALNRAAMDSIHLVPFRHLLRRKLLDGVMTAHVIYPEIDPEMATFSPYWIQVILRSSLKFDGVVMTDCMEMGAVVHGMNPEDTAVKAVIAGVDVITASRSLDFQKRMQAGIVAAVHSGRIPESRIDLSVKRILRLKMRRGLLAAAQKRDLENAKSVSRSHRSAEVRLAEASITVVRDRDRMIPVPRTSRLLVLEWEKVVATEVLSQGEHRSVLEVPMKHFYPHGEVVMLGLDGAWPDSLRERIFAADRVLAAVFSRFPEVEKIQRKILRRLIRLRPDTLVVALGNPYDLQGVPEAGTCVATYGYRRVQMEALLKVLSGGVPPRGRLPVSIPYSEFSL